MSHPPPKKIVIKINPPAKYEGLLRKVQRSSGANHHDPVPNKIPEEFDDIGVHTENGNGPIGKRKCARCSFTAKYPYDIYLHGINVHKRCTKCNEDFDSKKGNFKIKVEILFLKLIFLLEFQKCISYFLFLQAL